MIPVVAKIRQFMADTFGDEDIEIFCFDNFPEVLDNFGSGITKQKKIISLIQYCRYRDNLSHLVDLLRRTRPAQFDHAFPSEQQSDYLTALKLELEAVLSQALERTRMQRVPLNGHQVKSPHKKPPADQNRAFPFGRGTAPSNSVDARKANDLDNLLDKAVGKVVLVGAPGCGKTVALYSFALRAVDARINDVNRPIPIVAPIRTWEPRLYPSIEDWLSDVTPYIESRQLHEIVRKGQALLILDGLDELVAELQQENGPRIDQRDRFMRMLPATGTCIVSCRSYAFSALQEGTQYESCIRVNSLNGTQITAMAEGLTDEQVSYLMSVSSQKLDNSPLLVSLSIDLIRNQPHVSASIVQQLNVSPSAELRDEVIEKFVGRKYYEVIGNHQNVFTISDIYEVLGSIAMNDAGGGDNQNIFSKRDFMDRLPEKYNLEVFVEQCKMLGLIVSEIDGRMRFLHRALRDHFAYRMAIREAKSEKETLRDRAAWALWEIADPRGIPVLTSLLDDPSKYVRGSAVGALMRIDDPKVIPAISRLLTDKAEVNSLYGKTIGDVARSAVDHLLHVRRVH
jgi:hypothetical protein